MGLSHPVLAGQGRAWEEIDEKYTDQVHLLVSCQLAVIMSNTSQPYSGVAKLFAEILIGNQY